jgi:CO/xanthine dehydrogenase Mo-binding subunit
VTAIGRSVERSDGPLKVTGQVTYTVDLELPGMLHAKILRSPYPHARVGSVDVSAAAGIPGVVTLTADDLADLDHSFGVALRDQPVVAIDRVRFVGDPVAAVAAPTAAAAEAALDLIDVEYEPLDAVMDPEEAALPGAPRLHDSERPRSPMFVGWPPERFRENSNVCSGYHVEQGDLEAGFAAADHIFEDTYRLPPIHHGSLEPHAALAVWDGRGQLTVTSSTQSPSIVRSQLAEIFGLSENQVRVIVPHVGGAYGAKVYAKVEPITAALARKARRPVRLVLTREEVFATATRHACTVHIKTGVLSDGTIVARDVKAWYDTGAYADTGPRASKKGGYLAGGPYRIANESLTSYCVYTNKPPAVAFRGFGVPQVCWAYESQMDDIAARLGIDPLELRRRNLIRDGDTFVTGDVLREPGLAECLDEVARAVDWATPVPSRPGVLVGRGIACSIKSTSTPSNSAASVRLNADGSVHLLTSSVEIGQGSTTALAQLLAEALSMPVQRVTVSLPDTDVTPFDQSTISSRTTFSVGRAAVDAGSKIRDQLLDLAARQLEASTADLQIEDGVVFVRGSRDQGRSFAELIRGHFGSAAGSLFGDSVFQTRGGLDPLTGKGKASATWFYAAAAAEVEVDVDTGKVRILRIATAADVGKAINPIQCHLQNEGSMLTALGSALFEEMVFEGGQPINSSLLDYGMPSLEDHPHSFRSILVEHPSEDGPFGARGVGESVISPVAPAIGNAVAAALGGARVRQLPISPERVLAAIEQLQHAEVTA